jgi:hypothetical protein
MSDPTRDFFTDLAARGQVPMLRSMSGTLRFDLEDGARVEHWYVTVKRGTVSVSDGSGDADCAVKTSRELFDRLASGTANAMAAALRGLVQASGDLSLLISFQRLFPGPPRDCHREQAGYARRAT